MSTGIVPIENPENPVTLKEWLFDNKLVFFILIFAIFAFSNLAWVSYQIPNEMNNFIQSLSISNTPFILNLNKNRSYSILFVGSTSSPYRCGYISINNGKVIKSIINDIPVNLIFNQRLNLTTHIEALNKCDTLILNYGSTTTLTHGTIDISYKNSKIINIGKPKFFHKFCLSPSVNCDAN